MAFPLESPLLSLKEVKLPSEEEVSKNYDQWVSYNKNLTEIINKIYNREKEIIIIRNLFNKIVKPFFSDKTFVSEKVKIVKNTETGWKSKYDHENVIISYEVWYFVYTQYSDDDSEYTTFISVNGETKLHTKKNRQNKDLSFNSSEDESSFE